MWKGTYVLFVFFLFSFFHSLKIIITITTLVSSVYFPYRSISLLFALQLISSWYFTFVRSFVILLMITEHNLTCHYSLHYVWTYFMNRKSTIDTLRFAISTNSVLTNIQQRFTARQCKKISVFIAIWTYVHLATCSTLASLSDPTDDSIFISQMRFLAASKYIVLICRFRRTN